MSIFKTKLARYDNCQDVRPVPVTFLCKTTKPTPISTYDLFATSSTVQSECPPDIVPIQIGEWPTSSAQPPGAILVYTSSTTNTGDTEYPPPGFVECNGASYLQTLYPLLYNVIGTYYGDVGGPGTFNVPNLWNDSFRSVKYIIKADDTFSGYGTSFTMY